MKLADQNPYNQLLIKYVKQLQKHNEIDLELPQVDIQDVIDDPQQYARDYIEVMFVKLYKDFIDTYELGKKFARDNLNESEKEL